ncbi:hypothetical protein [Orenia marismortui]|uniref:hypothetical protein n=1 Tax=Orenia marismortui TaxID=46469 RepID=UPI00037ECFDF|nr:hypothetical protein [Orenia marismortui]
MRRLIILVLSILLVISFYLYYHNQWKLRDEDLNHFKEVLAKEIIVPAEKRTEKKNDIEKKDEDIQIKSPFNSNLKLEKRDDFHQRSSQDSIKLGEGRLEIKKPPFRLKGILKVANKELINIEFERENHRLKLGDRLDGFTLIEVLKGEVTFKKEDRSFKFKLAE